MKLLLLVGCLVAGALGGAVFPSAAKASEGARDWASNANAAQNWAAQGKNNGRNSGYYGNDAAHSTGKNQQTGSDYGSRASNWDQNSSAAKKAADQASASSWEKNQWGEKNDANRDLRDQLWAQGNQWYKGRRNNDGIDYAYDKKFDLKDSENGGFEYAESANSHALDDFRDRAASYDRNVDKDAARASAADAQKANRQAASAQNAGAADSSWDKFARNSAKVASADGRNKDWVQKLDQSQGADRQWSDARKSASDIYKDLATADGSYKRNAKAFGGKNGVYDNNVYAYGVGGPGGYAAKPFYNAPHGVNGYAKAGAAGDVAQAWDQAAKTGLRQSEGAASEDRTKASFNRDQWLNDRVNGFNRNNKAAADDKGFSDWARQTAKSAKKYDAANADAASKWNKDQAKSAFNEDLWKKEAEKKRLSDRDQNKKVYKKWFNNKNRGGNNWERLKYDRDQADDAFGYDTSAKKDWAQSAQDSHWNQRFDANAKDAQAARAAAASRAANNADWKKDAAGWQNAHAAANSKDAAQKRGVNNEAWKQDQSKNTYDARAQNQQQWDRDANRYGAKTGVVAGYHGYPTNGYLNAGTKTGVVGGYNGYPTNGYLNAGANYGGYPSSGSYYGGYPGSGSYYGAYPNRYGYNSAGKGFYGI